MDWYGICLEYKNNFVWKVEREKRERKRLKEREKKREKKRVTCVMPVSCVQKALSVGLSQGCR